MFLGVSVLSLCISSTYDTVFCINRKQLLFDTHPQNDLYHILLRIPKTNFLVARLMCATVLSFTCSLVSLCMVPFLEK